MLTAYQKQTIPSKRMLQHMYERHSLKELKKIYGVGITTIYAWLRHYNIPVREQGLNVVPQNRVTDPADIEVMVELRKAGLSYRKIAAKFDDYDPPLSHHAVRATIRRATVSA